jgi:uncharacterized protein YbcC (UPF0753/DUF2309 family)
MGQVTAVRVSDQARQALRAHLHELIEHAAHLLPAQGPIRVFIHHNTLHAFEDLPFDEAVTRAGRIFGCHPYLPEERYRQQLARGRIRDADVQAVLRQDLGKRGDEPILHLGTRRGLRRTMLLYPLRLAPPAELRWFVAQKDALQLFRDQAPPLLRETFVEETRQWVMRQVGAGPSDGSSGGSRPHERRFHDALNALLDRFGRSSIERWSNSTWEAFTLQLLWQICRDGVRRVRKAASTEPAVARPRDLLLAATGQDSDDLVHEVLIRFCAAFLDQGLARWPLPERERGFYHAFGALYRNKGGSPDRWLRGLPRELARLHEAQLDPAESILESLELLGIAEKDWPTFIAASLLALRGWAGMIHQLEVRGDRVARPAPAGSLLEFLALRLLLDRLALAHIAYETLGFGEPLHRFGQVAARRIAPPSPGVEQRAFLVFHLAQLLGWLPGELYRMSKQQWTTLVEEIEAFPSLERRRIFQLAFERRYRMQTLDAIVAHCRRPAAPVLASPRFQVICCLDERKESLRRHLEELAPDAETFGVAGFFSVAMYYKGAAEAHFTPLCPVVIRPQHWVVEEVADSLGEMHRRRAQTRRALGKLWHHVHVGSRTLAGGAVVAILGALASIPLVARVLFPRVTAWIRRSAGRLIQPPASTRLHLERVQSTAGPEPGQIGFTVDEMAAIVERVLRDIGLTANFARLIVVTGHGSVSLNNPHESAHDCGACGGAVGGPNARALAQMANDPRVRELLHAHGLAVPAETVFVGALHNSCDDSWEFYDLDRLPNSHRPEFEGTRQLLEQVCERNAHERCRRFHSAPLDLSFAAARRHVEGRSQDLAETRPEYGHASNAVCFVGRRQRTRGLFMDRRTFLASYDPTQDDDRQSILTRILQAAVPVCVGINLEYYFSFVDPSGWGCGTKLPHNITSLLGVMDGAASDLRPGLPWQMVEIHEPVRLLLVIETTPEAMSALFERQPDIARIFRNEWAQLATLDPGSAEVHWFHKGQFEVYRPETHELPLVDSSLDWYRGARDHLGYAQVRSRPGRAEGRETPVGGLDSNRGLTPLGSPSGATHGR